MNYLKSQKGTLTLGGLVFLIIVLICSYVGVKMALPLITNWQVKEVFRNEVAHLKTASEEEVRKIVLLRLKELDVSLHIDGYSEDGLSIYHSDEYNDASPYIMEATYYVNVSFLGGHEYTYEFNPMKIAKQ